MSPSIGRKRSSLPPSVDWSSVPYHLLHLILSKLNCRLRDCIVVAATCRDWHAAAKQSNTSFHNNWLMPITTSRFNHQTAAETAVRVFYDVSTSTSKPIHLYLPEMKGFIVFGSLFDSWLIAFRARTYFLKPEVKLLNPFSRSSIPLPDLSAILDSSYDRIVNAVLTARPGDSDCLVIIKYMPGKVAFVKPGSDVWCGIHTGFLVHDFVYLNRILYCLRVLSYPHHTTCDRYDLWSLQHNPPQAPPHQLDHRVTQLYQLWEYGGEGEGRINMAYHLVEIQKQICMLVKFRKGLKSFEIFKLDVDTEEWKQVESLGNLCLVVQDNMTFSVVDSRQDYKLIPGCIYYPITGGTAYKNIGCWPCVGKYRPDLDVASQSGKKVIYYPSTSMNGSTRIWTQSNDDPLDTYSKIYPSILLGTNSYLTSYL